MAAPEADVGRFVRWDNLPRGNAMRQVILLRRVMRIMIRELMLAGLVIFLVLISLATVDLRVLVVGLGITIFMLLGRERFGWKQGLKSHAVILSICLLFAGICRYATWEDRWRFGPQLIDAFIQHALGLVAAQALAALIVVFCLADRIWDQKKIPCEADWVAE
jgi:hypothetical protein